MTTSNRHLYLDRLPLRLMPIHHWRLRWAGEIEFFFLASLPNNTNQAWDFSEVWPPRRTTVAVGKFQFWSHLFQSTIRFSRWFLVVPIFGITWAAIPANFWDPGANADAVDGSFWRNAEYPSFQFGSAIGETDYGGNQGQVGTGRWKPEGGEEVYQWSDTCLSDTNKFRDNKSTGSIHLEAPSLRKEAASISPSISSETSSTSGQEAQHDHTDSSSVSIGRSESDDDKKRDLPKPQSMPILSSLMSDLKREIAAEVNKSGNANGVSIKKTEDEKPVWRIHS